MNPAFYIITGIIVVVFLIIACLGSTRRERDFGGVIDNRPRQQQDTDPLYDDAPLPVTGKVDEFPGATDEQWDDYRRERAVDGYVQGVGGR